MSLQIIDKILEIINEEKIDYVVMGTKGATGLKEAFLGTETTNVMNDTHAMVLAVPEHCQFQPVKKILFLTQYNQEDLKAMKKAIELAKIFDAHIYCLYVKGFHLTNTVDKMEAWEEMVKGKDITLHTIPGNDVEGIVLDFMELHKINMIAMHVHHQGFFGKLFQISLSKKLTFHVNLPILAIPE